MGFSPLTNQRDPEQILDPSSSAEMSNFKSSSKLAISALTELLPETNRCLSGISLFLKTTGE